MMITTNQPATQTAWLMMITTNQPASRPGRLAMIIVVLGRKSEATIACARASARARGHTRNHNPRKTDP